MIGRGFVVLFMVGLLSAMTPSPTFAQSSLDEILKRKIIRIGVDMVAPAFAFTDDKQQPAGSEVETANLPKRFPERNHQIKVAIPPGNWYAFAARRNETDLLHWATAFVFFHRANGDLGRIDEKWIGDKLPKPATL